MASTTSSRIVVDPTGDTLVALNNSEVVFAVWTEVLDITSGSRNTTPEETGDEFAYKEEREGEESPNWVKWGETDLEHDERGQPELQDDLGDSSLSNAWIEETSIYSTETGPSKLETPTAIVYQVSLAHLTTASPKFRSELQSSREHPEGYSFFYLECSKWDPEAFEILLNTLHTRYRRVPKQLTLEMLAKVAVMVDHYQCWEAFEPMSKTWIRHVSAHHPMPLTYNRDLMLWMLVAWVFKLPKEFAKTTAIALMQCTESSIQHMELGFPSSMLQVLENRRIRVIEEIIATFDYWIDKFSNDYTCRVDINLSFECSSILLGALIKQMRNMGILSLEAVAPFYGFSIEKVYESVKLVKSPIWETYDEVNQLYPIKHSCGFQGTLVRGIEHILARVKGLSLDDFVDCSEDIEGLTLGCP